MTVHEKHRSTSRAFTLIELVIVIAVIAILAALSAVGYGTWRKTMAANELKSDLTNLASAMESKKNFGNGYPLLTANSTFDGSGTNASLFKSSSNVTLTYIEGSASSFCIEAKSKTYPTLTYYMNTTDQKTPVQGTCAGGPGEAPTTAGEEWAANSVSGGYGGLWEAVTYGNGRFVAVRPGGSMSSTDGQSWNIDNNGQSHAWNSVAYGNGRFVAVGPSFVDYGSGPEEVSGVAATSIDGKSWTWAGNVPVGKWNSITYGNGRFVAVGYRDDNLPFAYNRIMSSTDGMNWTAHAEPSFYGNDDWGSVTYGNGRFVAVSMNGVMTSTDGQTWTADAVPNRNWSTVTYGNGRFVAVSGSYSMTSTDGIHWTEYTDGPGMQFIAYGGGRFVSISYNSVGTSTNGQSWTQHTIPSGAWTSITYGTGCFVAVGPYNQTMRSCEW